MDLSYAERISKGLSILSRTVLQAKGGACIASYQKLRGDKKVYMNTRFSAITEAVEGQDIVGT